MSTAPVLPLEAITQRIVVPREQKVLIDADLAALYGVETRRLNEQVRRNKARFPEDFIFELSAEEFAHLKSQFATSSWGGRRKLPLAFTEHGAIMAATVLNTPRAVEVSVYVVRAFVKLRELVGKHVRVVRLRAQRKSVHHQGQQLVDAAAQVAGAKRQPDDIDANHRLNSRSSAASSRV